jgi:transposase
MGWNLAKGDEFLPEFSLDELREMQHQEDKAKPKLRLLAALKRKEGQSFDSIAKQLEMKRITTNKLLHRFQEKGISAKDDGQRSGRPRELNKAQLKNLRNRLIAGPRKGQSHLWTTKMVMAYVEKRYGTKYTTRHMRRLLGQLGFSVQKPRPRHYKADLEKQAHFKKISARHLESIENGASQFFVWTRPSSP